MATKLDKNLTRESTIQIGGRNIMVTITENQEIELKLKGRKSGEMLISLEELYKQLSGDKIPLQNTGYLVIKNDKETTKDKLDFVNIHDLRSKILISSVIDNNTKAYIDGMICQIINENK